MSKSGIPTILVGGAVAAIYSEGAYRSGCLDINIESSKVSDKMLAEAMNMIGFSKIGRLWVHPDCSHLYVDFLSPPIAIGDGYYIKPIEIQKYGQSIKILSAEDCVRDRLASYVCFKARECFDQAYLVVNKQKIELKKISKWPTKEGKEMEKAVIELEEKIGSEQTFNWHRSHPIGRHSMRQFACGFVLRTKAAPTVSITASMSLTAHYTAFRFIWKVIIFS